MGGRGGIYKEKRSIKLNHKILPTSCIFTDYTDAAWNILSAFVTIVGTGLASRRSNAAEILGGEEKERTCPSWPRPSSMFASHDSHC